MMDYFFYSTHICSHPTPPFTDSSIAFFCSGCGEIWGRIVVADTDYVCINRGCPNCGPQHTEDPAGCLSNKTAWRSWEALLPFTEAPREVLINDFKQLEKQYDRNV